MMVQAGQLTEYLDFYKIVETQSESGFKSVSEQYQFTTRAERLKNKQNYMVNADELFHVTELSFRLRFRRDIDLTNIVKYEDERYRITSIDKYTYDNEITIILSKINE